MITTSAPFSHLAFLAVWAVVVLRATVLHPRQVGIHFAIFPALAPRFAQAIISIRIVSPFPRYFEGVRALPHRVAGRLSPFGCPPHFTVRRSACALAPDQRCRPPHR